MVDSWLSNILAGIQQIWGKWRQYGDCPSQAIARAPQAGALERHVLRLCPKLPYARHSLSESGHPLQVIAENQDEAAEAASSNGATHPGGTSPVGVVSPFAQPTSPAAPSSPRFCHFSRALHLSF
jgi:hypothetical protein